MELYSLYIHVPFCRHRCSYCDFNTYAHQEGLIGRYGQAVCAELGAVAAAAPNAAGEKISVHTVFFGGGTPSLLPLAVFSAIFQTIRQKYTLVGAEGGSGEPEISVEANPGTVTLEYLRGLRDLGVNRLSLGMQSAHPDDLRLLERQHDFFDVSQAVRWARAAGFENLSLDLMFALPGQPLERWQNTLDAAIGLQPEHLSLYNLGIEPGTPLEKRFRRGLIPLVEDDLAADQYEAAIARLANAGYAQYEISNWTKPGRACIHNLQYWRNLPYLGIGAGAHGSAAGVRTANVGGIRPYIERCEAGKPEGKSAAFPTSPATRRCLTISRRTEMQETMMVGLRLTQEGINADRFAVRFQIRPEEAFPKEVNYLLKVGLLEWHADCLRLTPRGVLMGNQVFLQFVGE